jgi:hypothetical protein
MTPQERDVIAGIFDRLRQAANQPRDPEAEAFIAERLREQPYAPYAMAQAVYVQEEALANLNREVESLRAQLREAQPAQPQAGGFLSGIFGGSAPPRSGSVPPVPPRAGTGAPSAVWNTQARGGAGQSDQAQPGPWSNQQPRGGGFLASALTTAAGVAGGVMLGNVLANAFGGGGKPASETGSGAAPQQAVEDRTAQDRGHDGEAGYDQASFDDDAGFDDGGGGDWA